MRWHRHAQLILQLLLGQHELDEHDVLLADLVGCAVRLPDGAPYGTIAKVEADEYQDRLIIHDGVPRCVLASHYTLNSPD